MDGGCEVDVTTLRTVEVMVVNRWAASHRKLKFPHGGLRPLTRQPDELTAGIPLYQQYYRT